MHSGPTFLMSIRPLNAMFRSSCFARAWCALALIAIGSPVGSAQQDATAPGPVSYSLWDYVVMSGFIGWCIIALSIVALALVLENFVALRREKLAPPELVGLVKSLFDAGQYQEALDLCENDRSFFARVCAAGISKVGQPYERIEHALVEAGNEEAVKLHQKVSWLSTIGALGPMLGLFGTVQGMILAFQVIASTVNPSPGQLATGIFVALLTTFEGLMVAMPVILAFAWLRNRLVRSILEIGAILESLFEKFRPES